MFDIHHRMQNVEASQFQEAIYWLKPEITERLSLRGWRDQILTNAFLVTQSNKESCIRTREAVVLDQLKF